MKDNTNDIGIYRIVNLITNDIYIGSTTNLRKRYGSHKAELKAKTHSSKRLQEDWERFGESAFDYQIIRLVDNPEELKEIEKRLIKELSPYYNSYGREDYSKEFTAEHRSNLSKALKQYKKTKKHLRALKRASAKLKAMPMTQKRLDQLRDAREKKALLRRKRLAEQMAQGLEAFADQQIINNKKDMVEQ